MENEARRVGKYRAGPLTTRERGSRMDRNKIITLGPLSPQMRGALRQFEDSLLELIERARNMSAVDATASQNRLNALIRLHDLLEQAQNDPIIQADPETAEVVAELFVKFGKMTLDDNLRDLTPNGRVREITRKASRKSHESAQNIKDKALIACHERLKIPGAVKAKVAAEVAGMAWSDFLEAGSPARLRWKCEADAMDSIQRWITGKELKNWEKDACRRGLLPD